MKTDASPSRLVRSSRFLIYVIGFGLALLLARCESAARFASAPHGGASIAAAPVVHHTSPPAPRAK